MYRSRFGLPACTVANGCFHQVGEDGSSNLPTSTNSGWQVEMAIDMDAVSALCPNCHITLVESNSASISDLDTAEQSAAASGVNQISDSWDATGPPGTFSSSYFVYSGIATLAASGDSGYDGGGTSNTSYPAALPGVNAIGGTDLLQTATTRGFTDTVWSGSGSGCSGETKPSYQTDSSCSGRSYNDISADADPYTRLLILLIQVTEAILYGEARV